MAFLVFLSSPMACSFYDEFIALQQFTVGRLALGRRVLRRRWWFWRSRRDGRMVKFMDKKIIADAIAEAERNTSAELVAVVSPASDTYQSYILFYGLVSGSLIATSLWAEKAVTGFPLLLAIQLVITAL